MKSLLVAAMRWVFRHFLTLVVIVLVLISARLVQEEVTKLAVVESSLMTLDSGEREIRQFVDAKTLETSERVRRFDKKATDALGQRRAEIDERILQIRPLQKSLLSQLLPRLKDGAVVEGFVNNLKADVEIKLLEKEKFFIDGLLSAAKSAAMLGDNEKLLEQRRQELVSWLPKLDENMADQKKLLASFEWHDKHRWSEKNKQLKDLTKSHERLGIEIVAAHDRFRDRQKFIAGLQKLKDPAPFTIVRHEIEESLLALEQGKNALVERRLQNWVTKISTPIVSVMPTAIGILLLVILVPVGIKAFLYFLIAPIASRRPEICILPGCSGVIDVGETNVEGWSEAPKISAISASIAVGESQELLIHPEYLQSAPLQGMKDTKWLLDWSYPMSSLASGMFALTRIRTAHSEKVTVSATKEPLSEIGVFSIPEGSAVVLQPHCLVGLIQRRELPTRITSHWRLGTLSAWLTLQLRYLAFHGPTTLIVNGCRGVRIERAGSGRSINQAATIGFSANLAYATARTETFSSYLMGKQELFNDSFTGGPGFYIYEETPHFGKKSGITGRGLEGLTDFLLKVFGV